MQMQLKLSGSGNHHLELALTIMWHLSKAELEELIQRRSQNIPLESRADQKHQTSTRKIRSYIKSCTNMQI